ncbi:MAG: hypothetical protein FVQ79_09615 [Planctomycetes bacterium]|nr:hypothetical protein [Planctomycetota bacterium]
MSFTENLAKIKAAGHDVRKVLIDLSVAVTDQEFAVSGNRIYIWDAPDSTSAIEIKFNEVRNTIIPFVRQQGYRIPFERFYVTVASGLTGTMTILVGLEEIGKAEPIDNRSSDIASMAVIEGELRGDTAFENWDTEKTIGAVQSEVLVSNANRKACIVQAKSTNTGIIYIGFNNTVTTTKWVAELQAGMSFDVDDYRGAIHAIATAAGQLLGYGEW